MRKAAVLRSAPVGRKIVVVIAALIVGAALVAFWAQRRTAPAPAPGSREYELITRTFYRGLASLDVGLIDGARQEFVRAVDLAPGEPAAWANLGLAQLRLGDLDAAVAPIERAVTLAPADADVLLLAGRMYIARGDFDRGLDALRRAVALDPGSLRARFSLAEEIERGAGPDADAEAQRLMEELRALVPDNLAVLVERTRLAAKRGDAALLRDSVGGFDVQGWPPDAVIQHQNLAAAADAGDMAAAARATTLLRNVLVRTPAFREDLAAVRPPAEIIAQPFDRFLVLANVPARPAPADETLSYTAEPIEAGLGPDMLFVVPAGDERTLVAMAGQLALDWNNDFRMDMLIAEGGRVRLLLADADGALREAAAATLDATAAWAADIEMDGDLDAVLGADGQAPRVLRNNGNGSWVVIEPYPGVMGLRAFAWADVDADGDPDAAMLDGEGRLHVFANRQAGAFQRIAPPSDAGPFLALAAGDVNADGVLDLVTLTAAGGVRRASTSGAGWTEQDLALAGGVEPGGDPPGYRLLLEDLDNNGAVDVLASGNGRTAIWLAAEDGRFVPHAAAPAAEVLAVRDFDGDGRLDLAGLAGGQPVRLRASGTRNYHWQVIRPRAQELAGDQRINSFGVGGEIEVRAGRLTQKQILTGAPAHFGLGQQTAVDVARIVWPNGVMQAEFDPGIDGAIVAAQRLKGSCPWLFAYDGNAMRFVTDFLWRSPLGLRINAQDTAGIAQTEDWVKIRGDQLQPRDGVYDLRITAELWETHFIDHVALLVVDHPEDTEVFVDERFAREPPRLTVHTARNVRPVVSARDHHGLDVSGIVAARDGQHLAVFRRGQYQGIAEEHFVEVELAEPVSTTGPRWLIAQGWIYPTDSSINVAIGQGGHVQPRGLSLEAQGASGEWIVVSPDLGFPAGKNKTVLVDLQPVVRAGLSGARRLRLRTNLEIYWDWIATAHEAAVQARTTRLAAAGAELRFRGYSVTEHERADKPETPLYDRLASTSPRWRDLEGYYTRFGDVRPLVAAVEDRYVIMNAGDELVLRFTEAPPPPDGWTRDFVLIGDGWEKDGDFNTEFSQTVEPLPSHDGRSAYDRHRSDWVEYHTRYVTPALYLQGLRTR